MKQVFLAFFFYNFCFSFTQGRTLFHFQEESSPLLADNKFSESPFIRHKEVFKPKGDRFLDKSLFENNHAYCKRKAKCQVLQHSNCMGAKLPYHSTTLDLTDLFSEASVQEKLQIYEQYLRYIPKCWAVIQPFLCALYMPKCENGTVDLPSREMCRITLEPCKIIYNNSVFPEFFDCEDERIFPSKCRNDIHEMKFNTTGFCMEPLIKTDKSEWWFKDVEGCGLHCKDTLYTENENYQIHKLITYCALSSILLNLFAVTTFAIDWRTANKYPAKAIFYVNICFAISSGGWMVQFLGFDTREDIVCKKDGTLRKSEPSASENLSCVIVFYMVYYFLIAGLVWFMIFSYVWYMSSLQALGKIQERVDKKRAYFHLVAWSMPLILTITTMAVGEIDGDYTLGICFVGFVNMAARAGLLLAPLTCTMVVSVYIIIQGLILLVKVKIDSKEVISEHSARKIQSNIVRMGVFTIFMVLFYVITIGYHIYLYSHRHLWNASLENYILCKLTSFSTDYSHCKQADRPSVAMLQLQLLALFGKGIAMASWVWCDATLHTWGRYIRKKFHCEVEEPMKIQKHKIIARAFAKRRKFNEGGMISIFSQNHTDPVGLQFELNSAASNELSTTWAKNLPRLVNRRPAVICESSCAQSVDSDFSLSYRHVSIESRRNSGDSQVSVQIAELKATRKINSRRHRRHNKRSFRGYSRNMGTSSRVTTNRSSKRGSSTSLDSHLLFINALTNGSQVPNPNLNRRKANAGLDGNQIEQLLSNGKLVIPHNMHTGSEDENVSVTISESMINMRVCNQNLDLNDHFTINQLKQGFKINQISTSEDSENKEKSDKVYEQEKRYSRSAKDSHSSRRSRKSKKSRKKYSSDSGEEIFEAVPSQSSSCPEIKQLVQSSLNSSVGFDKNSGSRQSKTSTDVAVQANAHDLDLEMKNKKNDQDTKKSKQTKTWENRKYKSKYVEDDENLSKNFKRIKKSKEKYKNDGTVDEKHQLQKDLNSENVSLILDENKVILKNCQSGNFEK